MDVDFRNVNIIDSGTYKLIHSISIKMFMKYKCPTRSTD